MSFLTLATTLGVSVIVISLITNMLKGILLAFSGLGLVFYLFAATPEQKNQLDAWASKISLPSSLDIQNIDVMSYINEGIASSKKLIADTAAEIKK